MSRPTKQVTTPSGHVVTMHSYMTGREFLEINESVKESNITIENKKVIGASGSFLENINKAILKVVLSVKLTGTDEELPKEKSLDAILDMELKDYLSVIEEIASLIETQKKNTPS